MKGYVTNRPAEKMTGQALISACHDLWRVEASSRMTESDVRARPVFHHQREAIEAHLIADPAITTEARAILNQLPPITTGHEDCGSRVRPRRVGSVLDERAEAHDPDEDGVGQHHVLAGSGPVPARR